MTVLFCLISFLASVIGAICGIGGGVIIKPVLDASQLLGVSTISFLSGCTVLSMSGYSVASIYIKKESRIDLKTSTFLGVGAAFGGVLGKSLFEWVKIQAGGQELLGAVQAATLFWFTLGTLLYMVFERKIETRHLQGKGPCAGMGILLGGISSFLGIGGGPMNLAVLGYFFSMSAKEAAQNSLYIILISQAVSLGAAWISGTVPEFEAGMLLGMMASGILGGILGRRLNRGLKEQTVRTLMKGLMLTVLGICVYNFLKYT